MQKKEKWFKDRLIDALSNADQKKLNLKPYPRSILKAISKFSNADGFSWPSTDQIEKETGIKKQNHWRYFDILKSRKFLVIQRQYCREKKMTRNYYTINLSAILELSIDQNGVIKTAISDVKSGCKIIEPNLKLKDGSKSERQGSNVDAPTVSLSRTNIEPNLTVRCKVDSTNKQDSKLIDFVQNKALDDIKIEWFDIFWSAYPRKEKKKEAFKIWRRDNLDKYAAKIIHDVRDRKARHDRWETDLYIPMPSTYLNNEQWEDEIVDRTAYKAHKTNLLTKREQNVVGMTDEYGNQWRLRNGKIT